MTHQERGGRWSPALNALDRLLPGIFRPKEESCVIEGIRFFGRVLDMDRQKLCACLRRMELDVDSELHLLRHFSSVSEEYALALIGKLVEGGEGRPVPITKEMIEQAVSTSGACEWSGKVKDPRSLFDLVKQEALSRAQNGALTVLKARDGIKVCLGFHAPGVTSLRNVLPIEEIPSSLRAGIGNELRGQLEGDRHLIKTLRGMSPPPTSRIAAFVSIEDGAAKLLSAYGGELAPEFPHSAQSPQERAYSEEFWERHVFLVGGQRG